MSKKLKIVQVINTLSCGGAEVFMANLSKTMSSDFNCKVVVIIYGGIKDEVGEDLRKLIKENNIELIDLECKTPLSKLMIPVYISRKLRKIQPDIVHTHLDQSDFFVYLSSWFYRKGITYIRTLHTAAFIKRIPWFFHKKMMNFYATNIACSSYVKKNLVDDGFSGKIEDIFNGINFKGYGIQPKLELKNDDLKLANVGNMNLIHGIGVKNQELLIKAVNKINSEGTYQMKLSLIGDGSRREYFEELINEYSLEDHVDLKGEISDVFGEVSKANFAVFPSLFEGLPLAAIEASVLGLPLIVSDIDAFKVFKENSTLSFKKNDLESLKEKLLYAIKNYDEIKSNALENVYLYRELYSIENCAAQYLNKYKEILDENS